MPEIERLGGDLYNPATGSSEDNRTPTTWKNVTLNAATAGINVWVPAAGKRFRLMGIKGTTGMNAASGTNDITVTLTDNGGGPVIAKFQAFVPTASLTTTPGSITLFEWNLPGNGYLSVTPTTGVVRIDLSTALVTGIVQINAWGTEE
jgi:hypothetical protein